MIDRKQAERERYDVRAQVRELEDCPTEILRIKAQVVSSPHKLAAMRQVLKERKLALRRELVYLENTDALLTKWWMARKLWRIKRG